MKNSHYHPYVAVVAINDCSDDGTASRQTTRMSALTGLPIQFIGIGNYADLTGAGHIIDALDSFTDLPGIIIANAAPRHGQGKKWPNGSPFCYFFVDNSLVVSTIQGSILSMVRKMGLVKMINVVDVPSVVAVMKQNGMVDEPTARRIVNSQFRSFDFEPRLVSMIIKGMQVPHEEMPIAQLAPHSVDGLVWHVDNFGNCKTTILPDDIGFMSGKTMQTRYGAFPCYERLKDVPNDVTALTIGSSGYLGMRLVEFVIQGKSAAKRYGVHTADRLI